MMKQSYEDYKYVMLDTAFLYLGAKYNYGEIIENEDIPFKFRAIIEHYILPEMDAETTLESHFYFMEKKEFSYKTYQQLKIKVKVSRLVTKRSFFGIGKPKRKYESEVIPLVKFVEMSKAQKEHDGILIQEIVINKFALMSFVV